MNKQWLLLLAAGISEIGWVTGLSHSTNAWQWTLTLLGLAFSFLSLMYVTKTLPVGTTYAVFTGIGAAGTVLGESLFFGTPINEIKLVLVAIMIVGIAGLKLTSSSAETAEGGD